MMSAMILVRQFNKSPAEQVIIKFQIQSSYTILLVGTTSLLISIYIYTIHTYSQVVCFSLQASDGLSDVTAEELAHELLSTHEDDSEECVTQEEYLFWAVKQPLTIDFLNLLIQVSSSMKILFT